MFENGHGKPLTERFGESPRAAGLARLSILAATAMLPMAAAVLVWQALTVLQKLDEHNAAIARIDAFVQGIEQTRKERDGQINSLVLENQRQGDHLVQIDGRLADHDSRLKCLEVGARCR